MSKSSIAVELPLEQLVTAVAVLDHQLRFETTNAAFCELFEVSASRLQGQPLQALISAGEILLALAKRAIVDRAPVAARAQQIIAVSGRQWLADIVASRLVDGRVLLEIHRLAPEIPVAQSRLSESLRGLAHEVKNPLAGVRGAAQLLRRRITAPDSQRLADLIISEADRLAALADRLLHPSGKPHLSMLNLHEIIEHARALIAAEAAPELHLGRDYDPSLPSLRGDADRLLQLLLNLMRNAVQAQAKSILVRTRAEHAAVVGGQPVRLALRLDVIDNGVGVPESLRDTLFLPLVSGRAAGTGLGLALAQEIAHEHGGYLSHQGRAGNTIFSLILPLEHAYG
jgi:two-component system, NtrC family, nitrogen regulation sensor histidine kinase GlnL